MIASLSRYAEANEATLGAGGAQKTMAEYAGAVQTDLDNTKTKTDELSSSMSTLATTASQKFTEVSKSVQDFEQYLYISLNIPQYYPHFLPPFFAFEYPNHVLKFQIHQLAYHYKNL